MIDFALSSEDTTLSPSRKTRLADTVPEESRMDPQDSTLNSVDGTTEAPASLGSHPLSGASNATRGQTSKSCTLCRRRKIKCDRAIPCGSCQRAGVQCVPSVPSRLPRGRQGGRKKRAADGELMERIAKLEGLVRSIEGEKEAPAEPSTKQGPIPKGTSGPQIINLSTTSSDAEVFAGGYQALHDSSGEASVARSRPPADQLDRYLGTSLWVTLSEEINGLKDVLGGSSDDEDEGQGEQTPPSDISSLGQPQSSHSGFVISPSMSTGPLIHPTRHQIHTLCDIYLANVHPVFTILHAPSLRRYLQEDGTSLECSPGPGGLEALRFAIYFAATVSMADGESRHRTGEDRRALLARFRAGTELALARADFVTTIEMSTLQALTIYLVSVRVDDSSRLMWTLTSLAIRIAQAMGLHNENTLSSRRPFDREMRRRLWWQICVLDSHAAEDRASNPVISADSFNTRLPLNINDEDLRFDSFKEVKEQQSFTDMTFCLICEEVFDTARQLNYVPARQIGATNVFTQSTWKERTALVMNTQQRIEEKHLIHLKLARPFHWTTRMVADVIIAIMWLILYRPLERLPKVPDKIMDPGVLRLSVEVLERSHQLNTDPGASPWRWLSQTYVQWHALAVTAAELCVKTEGPIVERAWAILEPFFNETALHVADSNRGMLWRPIKKLMNRAQGVRRQHLASRSALIDSSAYVAAMNISDEPNLANTEEAVPNIYDFPGDFIQPMEGLEQVPLVSASALDWDPWLAAATKPGTEVSQYNNDMNQMAWSNWEDFIAGFQDQDDMMSGLDAHTLGPSSI